MRRGRQLWGVEGEGCNIVQEMIRENLMIEKILKHDMTYNKRSNVSEYY
jgi:hypothetical protein